MTRAVVLCVGVLLAAQPARATDLQQVEEAVSVATDAYGGALSPAELYRAALDGIAAELDRTVGRTGHAVMSTAEKRQMDAWMDGERQGIAAEFSIVPGQGMVITDVYSGGPAQRAGLMVGDLVVAINDQPFTGLPSEAILAAAADAQTREVTLDLHRSEGLRRITVTRGPWRLDTARTTRHHDVTVLKLPFFGTGSARAVRSALADHPEQTPLVIDLRTNAGGRLDAMVDVASLFLPAGSPVVWVDRGSGAAELQAARPAVELPARSGLVVLVDRDTAGTAEAFAAALRREARAVVVGSPTAGLDGLPRWLPVQEELFLRVMVDQMRDPAGTPWAPGGIQPDLLSQPVSPPMPVRAGQLPPDVPLEVAVQIAAQSATWTSTEY